MPELWYADSSALVKLFADESETVALREMTNGHTVTTCELSLVEVPRALARLGIANFEASLLDRFDIVPLSHEVIARAASLPPTSLRSLDAIHVAAALSLDTRCDGLLTYERRMAEAAELSDLTVRSPGRDGFS